MKGRIMRGPRSTWGIAAALLAAGCFSVPPFQPEDAVTFAASSGGGGTISGQGFALRFADGDGFHFPDSLTIGGTEMIGRDPDRTCFDEDEIGIRIAPTPRITANGGAVPVNNVLTPVLKGPAAVQVKLDWTTRFGCNSERNPGGTSTFTVFPDGRIVRFDVLSDPSESQVSASPCACNPAGIDFTVATFWTLARGSFRELYRSDMPGPQPVPSGPSEEVPNTDKSCVDDGMHRVAFAWTENMGTTIRGNDNLIAFGRSFRINNSMLPAFTYENSSALFIGSADCEKAFVRGEEHVMPSPIMINGVATMPSARDGIYGGDRGDGQTAIDLPENRAELTGLVKSSYAVWVRFSRSVDAVSVTRTGASKPEYRPQQVDGRSWILWFREPIQTGQTIVIEPI